MSKRKSRNSEFIIEPKEDLTHDKDKKCFSCDQKVGDYIYLKLKNQNIYFHPDHFLCIFCDEFLSNTGYIEDNEKFYCENCYSNIKEKCNLCKNNINGNSTKIDKKFYHSECFKCEFCLISLNDVYYEKDNKFFCFSCFSQNNLNCLKCEKPIEEEMIEVDKGIYIHKNCLNCNLCSVSLLENHYILKDKKIYHPDCYIDQLNIICEKCNNKIKDFYLKKEDKYYHQECE